MTSIIIMSRGIYCLYYHMRSNNSIKMLVYIYGVWNSTGREKWLMIYESFGRSRAPEPEGHSVHAGIEKDNAHVSAVVCDDIILLRVSGILRINLITG